MDRGELRGWVEAYERAWRSSGTEALRELFAPDARYWTAPFSEPEVGLEAISRMWEREREGPDESFEITFEVVAVEGDTGVVRAEVSYGEPQPELYRDLWVITLDQQGRCSRYEEWPFKPPGAKRSG